MPDLPGNFTEIKSCYIGPEISPEQFIHEHFFLYLLKGKIEGYDGYKRYVLHAGQYCLVRKNHLARYNKQQDGGEFAKVVVILDEPFLKSYRYKYDIKQIRSSSADAFVPLEQSDLIPDFVKSLKPYYHPSGKITPAFADVKREELLLILLQTNPGLAEILFDFGVPQKIDLEAFMQRNYKFNVSIRRFAYLTGRSLSAFKRDFAAIFGQTPGRWLLQRRLQEARFLLEKKQTKPSDIYLDLGFEDLSHFSFSFKKKYGFSPGNLRAKAIK
ncbi:MAG TPA: AraC family transcriptional regulator [Mucilaginibacter sp.]|nr:AraC family transcriptional regulator [Mucilaginibacter sp.]